MKTKRFRILVDVEANAWIVVEARSADEAVQIALCDTQLKHDDIKHGDIKIVKAEVTDVLSEGK